MSKKLYEETDIQNIADSIREKNGLTTTYKVSEMAQAIKDISSGGALEEPYRIDSFDSNGNFIKTKLVGFTKIPYKYLTCTTLTEVDQSQSNITSIDDYGMAGCSITDFDLSKITKFGKYAMMGCKLLNIPECPPLITEISTYCFKSCPKLTFTEIPATIKKISDSALQQCSGLTEITFHGDTRLCEYCFYLCTNIEKLIFKGSATLDSSCFEGCTKLTQVIFEQKPVSISVSSFANCTALTDIKVSWSEGAVANAPWGASNATITYNYTGE